MLKDKFSKPQIIWQKPMTLVLKALVLPVIASIYFFGWRSILLIVISNLFGFLTEYIYNQFYEKPVTSSVFVTGTLFALTLPPTLPLWMAAIGIIVGVLFGKMVFGGFGRNVFNPALVGRAFIYINFGNFMVGGDIWKEPAGGLLGGFIKYSSDVITAATPLVTDQIVSYKNLLLGNTAGAIGATSSLFIILGALYMIYKKVANKKIIFSVILSAFFLQLLFYIFLEGTMNPVKSILSGGFLFGAVYMATDPISSANTKLGRLVYGIMIGALTVVIRVFSNWPEGIMFAILLANMFSPIVDYFIKNRNKSGEKS